jgi:hypothetical protein
VKNGEGSRAQRMASSKSSQTPRRVAGKGQSVGGSPPCQRVSAMRGGAGDERAALAPGWGKSPFHLDNRHRFATK